MVTLCYVDRMGSSTTSLRVHKAFHLLYSTVSKIINISFNSLGEIFLETLPLFPTLRSDLEKCLKQKERPREP